jgi:hypothetical protein
VIATFFKPVVAASVHVALATGAVAAAGSWGELPRHETRTIVIDKIATTRKIA